MRTFSHFGYGSQLSPPTSFDDLSSAELRLELAEAEATKVTTWKGSWQKKDRIAAITKELCERGAF